MLGGEISKVEGDRDRKMVNHIPGCFYLHSKKLLFLSMMKYYQKYILCYKDCKKMCFR